MWADNRLREALMGLNRVSLAAIGLTALVWSGVSAAQQYRAGEYLKLDLSNAVLSPKPLGPETSFTPGPLDVTIDRGKDVATTNTALVVDPKIVSAPAVHAESVSTTKTALKPVASASTRVARASADRPSRNKPRTLVALHGRNPTEAQARDTSVQVWPCKSGGICSWKR
jgi:hypothetical protein